MGVILSLLDYLIEVISTAETAKTLENDLNPYSSNSWFLLEIFFICFLIMKISKEKKKICWLIEKR